MHPVNHTYKQNHHPGNVRVTFARDDAGQPELLSHYDYYPYGMPMPGRQLNPTNHRYGYQGEFAEKDRETGFNHFEARLWDSRTGRWMIPDPAGQFHSPYLGMGNSPVIQVDEDGEWAFLAPFIMGAFINGAYSDMKGGNFWEGAWKGAITGAVTAAGAFGAAYVTTSIGVSGVFGGAAMGAFTGSVTGGFTGGVAAELNGGSFAEGFSSSLAKGAISGAIGGGITGGIKAGNTDKNIWWGTDRNYQLNAEGNGFVRNSKWSFFNRNKPLDVKINAPNVNQADSKLGCRWAIAESWEKSIGGNRTQADFETINARSGVNDFEDFLNEAGIKHMTTESANPQRVAVNLIKDPKFTVVSYGDGQTTMINGTKYNLDHLVAVKRGPVMARW